MHHSCRQETQAAATGAATGKYRYNSIASSLQPRERASSNQNAPAGATWQELAGMMRRMRRINSANDHEIRPPAAPTTARVGRQRMRMGADTDTIERQHRSRNNKTAIEPQRRSRAQSSPAAFGRCAPHPRRSRRHLCRLPRGDTAHTTVPSQEWLNRVSIGNTSTYAQTPCAS
jgi:hypothetical protein